MTNRKPIALAAILAAMTALPGPAEARRHYGWYRHHYARPHHRSPRVRLAREQAASDTPVAEPAPAAVPEAPAPRLHIIRPIVNGVPAKAWVGGPPSWAGALHVSPALMSGRSAGERQ